MYAKDTRLVVGPSGVCPSRHSFSQESREKDRNILAFVVSRFRLKHALRLS